jgi:ketosteroid isomerase-like protein
VFHPRKLSRIAPLAAILIAAILPAFASPASSACASTPADQTQVAEAMRTMYAAATNDDLDKFHTVAAPDFYAFDGGKRYDGDALMKMVRSFHDSGKVFVWTVTDPHVEATCDLAWITYINRGSMRDATGTLPLAWLESAVLEKQAGTWRIRFFHSTRVP